MYLDTKDCANRYVHNSRVSRKSPQLHRNLIIFFFYINNIVMTNLRVYVTEIKCIQSTQKQGYLFALCYITTCLTCLVSPQLLRAFVSKHVGWVRITQARTFKHNKSVPIKPHFSERVGDDVDYI